MYDTKKMRISSDDKKKNKFIYTFNVPQHEYSYYVTFTCRLQLTKPLMIKQSMRDIDSQTMYKEKERTRKRKKT